MKKSFAFLYFFLFISFLLPQTRAQSNCLSSILSSIFYSGIHGGYGFQEFNAEGFNGYINAFNGSPSRNLSDKMDDFGFVSGFKFGTNLFQLLVDNWVIGMKLSYHILKEEHNSSAVLSSTATEKTEYELTYKSFHLGISFAYYLSKHLDIKVMDLMMTVNSADLEMKQAVSGQPSTETDLTSYENPIGLNVSSGFTLFIIPPFISVEGTLGYSFFSIDEMIFENGGRLPVTENSNEPMTNFISGGGLYIFGQLNIAIPFN